MKLNENGTAKKFIFLEHNHYGKGEVTLFRKDTAGFRAFAPSDGGSYNVYNGCSWMISAMWNLSAGWTR